MANALPPIPFKTPFLDIRPNGKQEINQAWRKFIIELYARVGGTSGDFSQIILDELDNYLNNEYAELVSRIELAETAPGIV